MSGCDRTPSVPPNEVSPAVSQGASTNSVNDAVKPGDWFEDRTTASGVSFQFSTGREAQRNTILETVGGGVGIVDFDLDGRPDLVCMGGGTIDPTTSVPSGKASSLFRNLEGVRFRDVSRLSGVASQTDYSQGCVCGDVDSDGFPDLFITCYGRNCLLVNQGDGTFLDEAKSRRLLGNPSWHTAAAMGDVNGDGTLDLYVAGYVDWIPSEARYNDVPAPQAFHPVPDQLYLNNAGGLFVEVSAEAGIRRDGMGLGVVAADINDDRRIDFYVANDVVENHLYLGTEKFPWLETGVSAGVAFNEGGSPEGSMGIDCADVNGDGRPELWVTNFEMEDNSLYLNLGQGQFQHSTAAFRLAGVSRPQVKFGTGLRDFDGDGWLDLFVVCGHVRYHEGLQPFLQSAVLCRNERGTGFVDVTSSGGPWFRKVHSARGTATGDFEGDGGLDLVVSSLSEPVAILRNRLPAQNWLRVRLVGTRSSRTPIGSRVSLVAWGREIVRMVTSGSGYLSHSEDSLLLAVEPERTVADVTVAWPSGLTEVFSGLRMREAATLVEGRGRMVPMDIQPVGN